MKMGTTCSPWCYDAAAAQAIRPDNLRRTAIAPYALFAGIVRPSRLHHYWATLSIVPAVQWLPVAGKYPHDSREMPMDPHNRQKLDDRVRRAAETALAARKYVSPVDVLVGIGWLDPGALKRWQQGQVAYLEEVVQTNLPRISEAMRLFRSWAAAKGLGPSETAYIARTPARPTLRFSKSGDPTIEKLYRTHWISGDFPQKKQERLMERASRAPELVVIQPLNDNWKCHRCGSTGDFLIMEGPGPACPRCTGLDGLEFLPAGDALLTRRTKAISARYAVVVRFSRRRRRYERQGLLVEPRALSEVQGEQEQHNHECP